MPGKMVAGLCRAEAGINPDKEHKHTGLDTVTKSPVLSSCVAHTTLRQFGRALAILPQNYEDHALRSIGLENV